MTSTAGVRRSTRWPLPTVCHVLHGLTVGGAEVLAARLARRLRASYRFVFACLDELGTLGRELQEEAFPVRVLGRRPGIDAGCIRSLAAFWQRERVGLVHAHQYTPFIYSLAARLVHRRPAILFTEHGRLYPDYPRPRRMVANRFLLERRDRVIGVGEAVRQALITNEGIAQHRVSVIYNGIDPSDFGGVSDRDHTRRELRLAPHDFAILQVARFDQLKDHATAIRAAARAVRSHDRIRLLLVGHGPELGKIENLVRQNGLASVVRFLGLRRDIARLLAAADLFLLTSISEGIPLVLLEAMAARVPILATRVGGVAEVVEEGKTGLLAGAGDDRRLAESIVRLAADRALRQRLGDHGRQRALAMFSEERMHGRYGELYEEMLS